MDDKDKKDKKDSQYKDDDSTRCKPDLRESVDDDDEDD